MTSIQVEHRLSLSSEYLSLELIPGWGGRVSRLRALDSGADLLVPLEAHTFDPLDWPRAGAYPLVPYSNRIADARLNFQGRCWNLPAHPAAAPHTLHGVGHTLRWSATQSGRADEVTIATEYEGPHWPWAFSTSQRFRLRERTLEWHLSITNSSGSPMPAGLGFHPFFSIGSHSRATFDARQAWSMNAHCLPDGQRHALTEPVEWRAQENAGNEFVRYFSRWSGNAEIIGDAGVLTLRAGPSLSHLVAFAPASGKFLCLEPVSHVANGFNLDAQGHAGTGARTLAPGETWSEWIEMTWLPL